MQSVLGRITFGVSPASVGLAYFDWALHMTLAPGRQQEFTEKALGKTVRFLLHAAQVAPEGNAVAPCIEPLPLDRRFFDPEWRHLVGWDPRSIPSNASNGPRTGRST